jgi:hypothetical protein
MIKYTCRRQRIGVISMLDKAGRFKEFAVSKKSKGWIIAIAVLSVTGAVLLEQLGPKQEPVFLLEVLKDLLLVICTILGTNIVINVAIEKNSRNETVTDFIFNGFVSDPALYDNLSIEKKEALLKSLETNWYFDNNITIGDMHASVARKMKEYANLDYFFEIFSYSVQVKVENGLFIKTVSRTMCINSFKEQFELNKFKLAGIAYLQDDKDGYKVIEITSITLDGRKISPDAIDVSYSEVSDTLSKKNGYNVLEQHHLKEPIHLSRTKSRKIVINYITRCPVEDTVASYRVPVPCKRFTIDYMINPADGYRLLSHAFGFLDSADLSTNIPNDYCVKVEFEDFVFPNGGVAITAVKKNFE